MERNQADRGCQARRSERIGEGWAVEGVYCGEELRVRVAKETQGVGRSMHLMQ